VSSHVSVAVPTLQTREAYSECSGAALVRDESAAAEVGCCVATRRRERGFAVCSSTEGASRGGAGLGYRSRMFRGRGARGLAGGCLRSCLGASPLAASDSSSVVTGSSIIV